MISVMSDDADLKHPCNAALKNGNAIVVAASIGNDEDIYGQIIDATGNKVGGMITLNDITRRTISAPHAESLKNGNCVVVWKVHENGGGKSFYARVLDENGSHVSDAFLVASLDGSGQNSSVVVALDDDDSNFVIIWGNAVDICAQIFDSSGNRVGTEFQISPHYCPESSGWVDAATLPNGNFVVTWQNTDQDGDGFGIYAQILSSSGDPVSDVFLVNTTTTGDQMSPIVNVFDNGNFIIVWNSSYGQLFNVDGDKIGTEFIMTLPGSHLYSGGSAAAFGDKYVVMVWFVGEVYDGGVDGLYAKVFNSLDGTEVSDFVVATENGPGFSADITILNDGDFFISWHESPDGHGTIVSRIFNHNLLEDANSGASSTRLGCGWCRKLGF